MVNVEIVTIRSVVVLEHTVLYTLSVIMGITTVANNFQVKILLSCRLELNL